MTVQISQRGKEYLETARTSLRAAQTMADQAIAGQLKALAEDYQRNSILVSSLRSGRCAPAASDFAARSTSVANHTR